MEINQIKEKDENKKEIKEVIHITKDDLYRFNLYLASLNKNLGMVVGLSLIHISEPTRP